MRLKASRLAAVPNSRYLAVAGPKDLAESCLANSVSPAGAAHSHRRWPRDDDRFDLLAAEHGAAPATARVTAIV